MGAELGAEISLDRVPLKYDGLSATEVWISEAQERMVLAVPDHNWEKNNKVVIEEFKNIDMYNDFDSLASILKKIDLFITVSNSTAHLAGSLGVPTWLIKPKNHATFFYWNQNNNKTPWYRSIKIFSTKYKYKETILEIKKQLLKKFKIKN